MGIELSKKISDSKYDRNHGESLDIYLSEIGKTDLLEREEEYKIAEKASNGDQESIHNLVKSNLRFVVSVAKQYQNRGLPLDDLVSEGNLGMMRAANRFDEKKGFKFISYAVWWIKQSILQSLSKNSELPLNRVNELNKINKTIRKIEQEKMEYATPREISDYLDNRELNLEKIDDLIISNYKSISLDKDFGNRDENTMLDSISLDDEHTDETTIYNELKEHVNQSLSSLSEKEAEIIKLYFGIDEIREYTLDEIGNRFGLTRERIRQIKEKTLNKLRHKSRNSNLRSHVED
ncbi:RNA polymerase subunit sigma [archaeon]|nr:RNA polymerase subunit sigma [archaeon]|tara:strand:- start:4178 stop:5053 length:876 start_codon:yes stop_codon:yes gene_type:complete